MKVACTVLKLAMVSEAVVQSCFQNACFAEPDF
jgi:hypothetical protein